MYLVSVFLLSSSLFALNHEALENNIVRFGLPTDVECESYLEMPRSSTQIIKLTGESPLPCFYKYSHRVVSEKKKELINEQIDQRLPFYKSNGSHSVEGLTPPTHILEKSLTYEGMKESTALRLIHIHSGVVTWSTIRSQYIFFKYLSEIFKIVIFFALNCLLFTLLFPVKRFNEKRKLKAAYDKQYQKALNLLRNDSFLQGVDLLLACAKQNACPRTKQNAARALKELRLLNNKAA